MAEPSPASSWVIAGLSVLPPGARVLDFACGQGRHSLAALGLGLTVTAVDRDAQALSSLAAGADAQQPLSPSRLTLIQADLERDVWPFEPASFDVVIVCNYLFRPRLSDLPKLLQPGGLMIYETFAQGNEQYGRPSNPDYLLAPGELYTWAQSAGLHVLAYEDGTTNVGRRARIQRLRALRQPANLEAFALE